MKDKKTIYYKDEKNDDFGTIGIVPKPLGDSFRYVHKGLFWKILSFIMYRIVAQPISYLFIKIYHHQHFENKKALKIVKKQGAFIYANHTNYLLDAFVPNLLRARGRGYILVGPDATSIKGIKNLVVMLGAIPLGQNIKNNKDMLRCISYRINKKNIVAIYPEAHLWPYYTGVREYSPSSFRYPAQLNTPVFTITNCYQKRRFGEKPKVISYIDGPFYPDATLPVKERKEKLRDQCYSTMVERTTKYSTYSYVEYKKNREKD